MITRQWVYKNAEGEGGLNRMACVQRTGTLARYASDLRWPTTVGVQVEFNDLYLFHRATLAISTTKKCQRQSQNVYCYGCFIGDVHFCCYCKKYTGIVSNIYHSHRMVVEAHDC